MAEPVPNPAAGDPPWVRWARQPLTRGEAAFYLILWIFVFPAMWFVARVAWRLAHG